MNFLSNFIKGIFIGSGAILPGISSGVLCIAFGIYEKLLNSILNIFKDFKKNMAFLFPICLGGLFGFFIFSNILLILIENYPLPTNSLFIGLILGTMPALLKQASKYNIHDAKFKKQSKLKNTFIFLLTLLIGIVLFVIEKYINVDTSYTSNSFSFIYLLFCGICMSIGIIVPGVSSTIILMLLGVYSTYLSAITIVNMSVIFPMIIGVIIGSFIFMKIIKYLLDNFYTETMHGIIGFSLGSILILYPNFNFDILSMVSIVIIIFGFILSYILSFKEEK